MKKLLAVISATIMLSGCARETIIFNNETMEFEKIKDKPPVTINSLITKNPFHEDWVIYNKNIEKLCKEIQEDKYGKQIYEF